MAGSPLSRGEQILPESPTQSSPVGSCGGSDKISDWRARRHDPQWGRRGPGSARPREQKPLCRAHFSADVQPADPTLSRIDLLASSMTCAILLLGLVESLKSDSCLVFKNPSVSLHCMPEDLTNLVSKDTAGDSQIDTQRHCGCEGSDRMSDPAGEHRPEARAIRNSTRDTRHAGGVNFETSAVASITESAASTQTQPLEPGRNRQPSKLGTP